MAPKKQAPLDLSIVLPCYNEAANLPLIVERLAKYKTNLNFELIMVDNGSTDGSAAILKKLAKDQTFVKIFSIETNIGYGHGILQGLKVAKADILCYSHADIQTPPEDAIKAGEFLLKQKLNPTKTLVKGQRINRPQADNRFTRGLSQVAGLLLGYDLPDINGQPKLFHRDLLGTFENAPFDFSFDTYVLYMARKHGLKIETFPVDFGQRIHGESKASSTTLKKYKTILKYLVSLSKLTWTERGHRSNIISQGSKFLVTGILTNIANYAIFYALFALAGIYYLAASIAGFLTGFVIGFILNRSWTFTQKDQPSKRLRNYLWLNLLTLLINGLSIWLLTDLIDIQAEFSQILAITICAIVNFLGSKLWVFKETA